MPDIVYSFIFVRYWDSFIGKTFGIQWIREQFGENMWEAAVSDPGLLRNSGALFVLNTKCLLMPSNYEYPVSF